MLIRDNFIFFTMQKTNRAFDLVQKRVLCWFDQCFWTCLWRGTCKSGRAGRQHTPWYWYREWWGWENWVCGGKPSEWRGQSPNSSPSELCSPPSLPTLLSSSRTPVLSLSESVPQTELPSTDHILGIQLTKCESINLNHFSFFTFK